jgi:hypothetical protein
MIDIILSRPEAAVRTPGIGTRPSASPISTGNEHKSAGSAG